MLKKIIFTLIIMTCVCVLPSYTNTCAKPEANFLKSAPLKSDHCVVVEEPVRNVDRGLEVFPLGLISIQL